MTRLLRLDDVTRGAISGAFLGLVGSKATAAFAGWTLPDTGAYAAMAGGAILGIVIMWRAPQKIPVQAPYTGPTPAMLDLMRNYKGWQDAQLRQAVEPHAASLGIGVDVLMTTYSEINAEMKKVGAA